MLDNCHWVLDEDSERIRIKSSSMECLKQGGKSSEIVVTQKSSVRHLSYTYGHQSKRRARLF